MIRSKRGLVILGVATFLIALLATFPARIAYNWFAMPGFAMSGLTGTVWSGSAREANFGPLYLHDIRWKMRPGRLFTGAISYELQANATSGFIETAFSYSVTGKMAMNDLVASLPLSLAAPYFVVPDLSGSTSLRFERIEIVDGVPVAANGTVQVANLRVPLVSSDSLGDYKAEFTTRNNGIGASIEDVSAPIDFAGNLSVGHDRRYEFVGIVMARPSTPQSIRNALRFLPPPNARGQQEIREEGSF